MNPEVLRKLSEMRSVLERRGRKRARKSGRDDESISDMIERIQVFAKTQGRVVGSYTKRVKAAAARATLEDDQADKVAKVVGLMDQLNAAMRELEPAAKAVSV